MSSIRGRGSRGKGVTPSARSLPARGTSRAPTSGSGSGGRGVRLMRDFFPSGSRPILPSQAPLVVEYMGHSSATESSVLTASSTTTTPVPLVPTPSPQESSLLLFDDSDSESDILGEALHQADIQFCPDAQDLFEGLMEENDGVPAVSIPQTSLPTGAGGFVQETLAPSQTQASVRGQRSQASGSMSDTSLRPPHVSPGSDISGGEEEGDPTWVPPALSVHSSDDEEGRHPGEPVRQVTRGTSVRVSTGDGSRRCQQQQQQQAAPPVRTESQQVQVSVTPSDRRAALKSPVWAYFTLVADNQTIAICQICRARVKRGKCLARVGTTALNQHLRINHWREYEQLKSGGGSSATTTSVQGTAAPATASSVPSRSCPPAPSSRGTGTGSQTSTSTAPSSSVSCTAVRRQATLSKALERTTPFPPGDRRVRSLNGLLTRVIAQHLLPFNIVDCNPFRQMLEQAQPQWRVPSRHFFARTGVPALHQHIVQNVTLSLDHAVSNRVHLTMDGWTSRHGQGRYISFTAHWVSLRGAGEGSAASDFVVPPRGVQGRTAGLPQATVSAAAEPPSKRPRSYSSVGHVRCQAVLQLVSLGERRHTGKEVLTALQAQVQKWLTPRRLQAGMVVCDNGSNLLSALQAGSLTHVPCLAHVLNLVVQKFLRTYPGLSDIVLRVRRIASHFRRSPTATASLSKLQRDNSLPLHRLIVDSVTRWNSTLHMLERLWEQRRAVKEYLLEQGTGGPSQTLPYITSAEWEQIHQVCHVLAPFEQATKMVSREHVGLNDVLPILFLLDRALDRLLAAGESALVEQEEATLLHQDQAQDEEEEEDDDDDEEVTGGDVLESGPGQEGEPVLGAPIVRGLGISVREQQRLQHEESDVMDPGSHEESQRAVLFPMAAHMLRCLRRDPRVHAIKERDEFWMVTLLDPRCKGKVEQFLPASRRQQRMEELQALIVSRLEQANPRPPVVPPHLTQQVSAPSSSSSSRAGDLMGEMMIFFQSERPSTSSSSSSSRRHHQRLSHMVADYMGSVCASDSMITNDPMEYWVARLDTCRELAQYALELLSCPPSSVLSERTFSAAGGVVTDKRTRLSTDSVDRLTFIKMNESWIGGDFLAPAVGSGR